MSDERRLWHKRSDDWEPFDRITLEVVPRYKTSGMSGDEWRQHIQVNFYFKGQLVHEAGWRDMKTALMLLAGEFVKATCPIPSAVIEQEEKGLCDQPSCQDRAVGRFELKRQYERGRLLDPEEEKYSRYYRQFCERHLRRGDCSREDSDDNYVPLDGVGPECSTNVEESPSMIMGSWTSGDES